MSAAFFEGTWEAMCEVTWSNKRCCVVARGGASWCSVLRNARSQPLEHVHDNDNGHGHGPTHLVVRWEQRAPAREQRGGGGVLLLVVAVARRARRAGFGNPIGERRGADGLVCADLVCGWCGVMGPREGNGVSESGKGTQS